MNRIRRSRDRVAIIVRGGVVQDVVCDQPHDVLLIDYDNIGQGGDVCSYPASMDGKAVDQALRDARAIVRGYKRRRPQ